MDRIECQWCKAQNETGRTNCTTCGAPLDKKDLVTDSGWAEAPRLRDMTEFRFSSSTCQIEGEIVPVAEIALAQGDSVFFEHHVMLWKEPQVPMSALNTGGGMKRTLGGMPHILSVAHGPGRVAFSRDATGEVVVLPLHPSMEIDVREHAFLAGTHSLTYSFVRIKGLAERAARWRRHVHGPLRHPERARAAAPARVRQRVPEDAAARARRSWSSRAASCTRTRR